jgi:hypothetical protein
MCHFRKEIDYCSLSKSLFEAAPLGLGRKCRMFHIFRVLRGYQLLDRNCFLNPMISKCSGHPEDLVYFQDRDAEEPALETLSGASAGIGAMS